MLRTLGTGDMSTFMWKRKAHAWIPAQVYNYSLEISFIATGTVYNKNPLHMLFSFYLQAEAPAVLSSGLYDCSGPTFLSFRHHVDCNYILECEGLEDIESCPECDIQSKKCYKIYNWKFTTWHDARISCQLDGGDLAMMKTPGEWDTVIRVTSNIERKRLLWIGMHSLDSTMPNYYKHVYFWADKVASYSVNTTDVYFQAVIGEMCFFLFGKIILKRQVVYGNCGLRTMPGYICQRVFVNTPLSQAAVVLPSLSVPSHSNKPSNLSLVACEEGHWTRNFLSCDPESRCGDTHFQSHCSITVADVSAGDITDNDIISLTMFACEDETKGRTMPYTLVCDFRSDCEYGSDENFCVHTPPCNGFTCNNGQCVANDSYCNVRRDCWDGSDERCDQVHLPEGLTTRLSLPSIITFDGMSL